MQLPANSCNAMIIIALFIFSPAKSQPLSADEKTAAIQKIASHIASNYVYVEKGGEIASHILTAHHRGDFAKAGDWKTFDSLVTVSLRKFSGDGHLYVRRDPEVVRELKSPSAPQPDHEQMKHSDQKASDNYGFAEAKVLDQNIGYLKITEINISQKSLPALYAAMRKVENTNALIIDLRNNGGGGSDIGPVLESYFLPAGKPLLEFRMRNHTVNIDSAVTWLTEKKYDKPVYIIVNKKTASAAEAFAFVMQQNDRAKIVGEPSAGAAHMNEWFAIDDENYVSVSTAAPGLPRTHRSWEQTGIRPDIRIKKGDPVQQIISRVQKRP